MKITFIGLGIMGSRMAANLLEQHTELRVYNRTRSAAAALEKAGAEVADSAAAAVAGADLVFTMLSTPEVVEQVAFGTEGFVAAMGPQALWIDCSTVNPSFSLHCAQKAAAAGIRFFDIPVAGSLNQAQNKELVFLAGATAEELQSVEPLLAAMGKKTLPTGERGKGSALKMLVNSLLAQSMVMFCESVILGERMGLSRDFLLNFLPKLPVVAPFISSKIDNIRNDQYDPEFPLEWIQKDLHLLAQTAYEHSTPQYLSGMSKELYANAKQKGMGRLDFSAIYRFLEA
ncbi:MAG: NAD(P)-dependent oxidoreductase [Bacteroidota bacterium]